MNPFDTLPNEILYQMCHQWDRQTLEDMAEAYPRVKQVCRNLFDPFEDLPNEMIHALCHNMDTPTLLKMSKVSHSWHQACSNIISKRFTRPTVFDSITIGGQPFDITRVTSELARSGGYTQKELVQIAKTIGIKATYPRKQDLVNAIIREYIRVKLS